MKKSENLTALFIVLLIIIIFIAGYFYINSKNLYISHKINTSEKKDSKKEEEKKEETISFLDINTKYGSSPTAEEEFTLTNGETIKLKYIKTEQEEKILAGEKVLNTYNKINKVGLLDNNLIVVEFLKKDDETPLYYREYFDLEYNSLKIVDWVLDEPNILSKDYYFRKYTGTCLEGHIRVDHKYQVLITSKEDITEKFIEEIRMENCAGMS